ncbi:MAG: hypothetical protein J6A15_00950 [Clostridia bacterium]|nr:hypothetical protein [Clostridia bacterium]
MVEQEIRHEIHDMSSRIKELQDTQNTLTNGQRYAAINEIEKSIQPLRNDLHHLERELYSQESDDKILQEQIDKILIQISSLEDIKSDLTTRINTETEHTRQELNDKIINFMADELKPIQESIKNNQSEITAIKESINELKIEIVNFEKDQEINSAKRFDKVSLILAGVIGVVAGVSTLSVALEPFVRTLIGIFF